MTAWEIPFFYVRLTSSFVWLGSVGKKQRVADRRYAFFILINLKLCIGGEQKVCVAPGLFCQLQRPPRLRIDGARRRDFLAAAIRFVA